MSHIDEALLAFKSPVPFSALADVGTLTRGKRFVKSDMIAAGKPCIHYGEIYTKYGVSAHKTHSFLAVEHAARLRSASTGDVIIASAGETVEDIGKAVAWLGDSDVVIHDACYAFHSTLDPKYVSYFFRTDDFKNQVRKHISTSKISAISTQNLGRVRIPVPHLKVQREIVRILDNFTELETELEAELESRRRQYAFYRDSLLTFPKEGVRRIPMGDAGIFFGGLTGKSKADFSNGNARFVSYVNVFRNIAVNLQADDFVRVELGERQRVLQRGDVLFTGSSETPHEVGMSSVITTDTNEPTYLNSFSIGYRLNEPELLNPDFAKHLFRSTGMRQQIFRTASGVTRFNVSKARLAKVEFPIPSKDEQTRIARVLDNFELLVNDLSFGLPAELAARRKQYEYYRDRLLTFEEAPA